MAKEHKEPKEAKADSRPPAGFPAWAAWPPRYVIRDSSRAPEFKCNSAIYDTEEEAKKVATHIVKEGLIESRRALEEYFRAVDNAQEEKSVRDRLSSQRLRESIRPYEIQREAARRVVWDKLDADKEAYVYPEESAYQAARAKFSTNLESQDYRVYSEEYTKRDNAIKAFRRHLESESETLLWVIDQEYTNATQPFTDPYTQEKEEIRLIYDSSMRAAKESCIATSLQDITPGYAQWVEVEQEKYNQSDKFLWSEQSFWVSRYSSKLIDKHFPIPGTEAGTVSFIATPTHGQIGRRTVMKAGRFLTRFFGEKLTEKQIAFLASWQTTGVRLNQYSEESEYRLGFAASPDDIERVYKNGPDSCMDGRKRFAVHPSRVYGAGDLAVAYIAPKNMTHDPKYVARALVWPEKKVMGRIYPTYNGDQDTQDARAELERRLLAQGYASIYTDNSLFNGARLLKLPSPNGGYVMPYIDVIFTFSKHPKENCFVMQEKGVFRGESTTGVAYIDSDDLQEDFEPDDDSYWCPNCEESCDSFGPVVTRVDSDGRATQYHDWCNHCRENHTFFCHGIGETVSDGVGGAEPADSSNLYTVAWLENNAQRCDVSGDYYVNTRLNPVITEHGTETWCADEVESGAFICPITQTLVSYGYGTEHEGIEGGWYSNAVTEAELQEYLAETVIEEPEPV